MFVSVRRRDVVNGDDCVTGRFWMLGENEIKRMKEYR